MTRLIFTIAAVALLLMTVPGPGLPPVHASSNFGDTGSASGPDFSSATCTVFTGPRELTARALFSLPMNFF